MVVGSSEKVHFKLQSSTKMKDVIGRIFQRLEKELGHQLYAKGHVIGIIMETKIYISLHPLPSTTFLLNAHLVSFCLVSIDSELLSFHSSNSELLRSTKFHFKTYSSSEVII